MKLNVYCYCVDGNLENNCNVSLEAWREVDVLGEKGHRDKTWNSELSYVKYMDEDPNITGN